VFFFHAMKRISLSLLLAGALLVPTMSVQAAPHFPITGKWMDEKVTPSAQALPVDEALLALSKAASANVLADATHFEAGRVVQPYPARQTDPFDSNFGGRGGVVGYTAARAGLSFDRSSSDTFVFWSQPDRDQLVSLIVSYQKQLNEQFPRSDGKDTLLKIQEFLKTRYGWNPQAQTPEEAVKRAQGVEASFRLGDLPEELRAPFQAELISRVRSSGNEPTYRWFEADYWKDCHIRLNTGQQNVYDAVGIISAQHKSPDVELVFPDVSSDDGAGTRSIAFGRTVAIGFPHGATAGAFTPTRVQTQGRTEVQPAAVPAANLPVEQLTTVASPRVNVEGEASLQKTVVFSVKRQPLTHFAAELAKQSGISLAIAPDTAPGAQVTGCSVAAGMPLASAMGALSRLYSAHWTKDGDGYTLSSDHPSELTRMMAQMGIYAYYGSTRLSSQEHDALGTERADEIVDALGAAQLKTPSGAPFSSLPADTQDSVLRFVQKERQGDLITAQQRLSDALDQEVVFRFGPLRDDTPLFDGDGRTVRVGTGVSSSSRIGAYASDGAFIAGLFPRFTFRAPTRRQIEFYRASQPPAQQTQAQEGNDGQ